METGEDDESTSAANVDPAKPNSAEPAHTQIVSSSFLIEFPRARLIWFRAAYSISFADTSADTRRGRISPQ